MCPQEFADFVSDEVAQGEVKREEPELPRNWGGLEDIVEDGHIDDDNCKGK